MCDAFGCTLTETELTCQRPVRERLRAGASRRSFAAAAGLAIPRVLGLGIDRIVVGLADRQAPHPEQVVLELSQWALEVEGDRRDRFRPQDVDAHHGRLIARGDYDDRPLQAVEDGHVLRLLAPNRFVVDWVNENVVNRISELVDAVGSEPVPSIVLETGGLPLMGGLEAGSSVPDGTGGLNGRPELHTSSVHWLPSLHAAPSASC